MSKDNKHRVHKSSDNRLSLPPIKSGEVIRVILPGDNSKLVEATITNNSKETVKLSVNGGTISFSGCSDILGEISIQEKSYYCYASKITNDVEGHLVMRLDDIYTRCKPE